MKSKSFLALLLSYFCPGAGFWYARNKSWGIFYFVLFLGFCSLNYRIATSLTENSNSLYWLTSISITILIVTASAAHSFVYALRKETMGRASLGVLLVLVLVIQISLNYGFTKVRQEYIDCFTVPSEALNPELDEKDRFFFLKRFNRDQLKVGQLVVYQNENKPLEVKKVTGKEDPGSVIGLAKVIWYSRNYKKIGRELAPSP